MSVILTNKEMPENCEACGAYYKNSDMTLRCPYSDLNVSDCEGKRHKDCPLVDIKDPKVFPYWDSNDNIWLRISAIGRVITDIKMNREQAKSLKKNLKTALKAIKETKDELS